ncbi:MAG: monovalent cation/H(+) antiporter subunit G [Halioglobus sp.]
MALLLDALSWFMLIGGGLFVLIGGVGIVRLPDVYTRMHAASLTDTMGTLMILFGIMLQAGLSLAALKLAAIALFLMLTGPTATYALANAAMLSGLRPDNVEMPEDLPEDMQL